MNVKKLFPLVVALAFAGTFAACGGGGGGGGGGSAGTGTVAVSLTDAPFPYEMVSQANVVVTKVTIRGKGDTGAGWSIIDSQTRAYDLVQLQQGKKAIIGTTQVPAGTYDEIRIVVPSATITLTDGRSFNLNVPSGDASGLKVKLDPPIVVTTGLAKEVVLDFDLAQSFSPIPNAPTKVQDIGDFQMHPVIRGSAAEASGAITGKVTTSAGAPVADATVTATRSDGTLTQTTKTGADGTYYLGFLPAGTYTVTAESTGQAPVTKTGVAVPTANQTTVNLSF